MSEKYKPPAYEEMTKAELIKIIQDLASRNSELFAELMHLRKQVPPHLQQVHRLRDDIIRMMVTLEHEDDQIAKAMSTTSTVVSRIRRAMGVKKQKGRPPKQ